MPSRISSPPRTALPAELNDLVTLHSSFLTALSLHYAHHGTTTPVDTRILSASMASVWGKRRVTLEDIKLCIGIMDSRDGTGTHPLELSDYGSGKICIEIDSEQHRAGPMARHINENALHKLFTENLASLWQSFTQAHSSSKSPSRPIAQPKKRGRPSKALPKTQPTIDTFMTEASLNTFFSQLPQAPVTVCESLAKVAPLREKGRKRLRDIKDTVEQTRSVSIKKTKPTTPSTTDKENEPAPQAQAQAPVQAKITSFATTRKTNLLDRILAKQEAASKLPNPPSAAEQSRKAALQRSEEVLSVLSLLASSRGMASQRVSFSMATLVQSLQGSVRSPISKEEAMKCVEILANEVAPGFVNLVKMGTMSSVVVNQAMRPLDLRMRLVSLGAEL